MTLTARPRLAILLIALAALVLSLTAPPWVEAQQGSVPDKPTGVVTAATHDSVTLAWDDPDDSSITHYQIFRRDRDVHETGEFVTIKDDTDSADASYTDDTVETNRRYVYRVKAVNTHGASRWSSFARADTFRAANLRAIEVTADMVTLAWDAPAGFGAKVYREGGGSSKRSIRANPRIIGTEWTDGGEETPTSLQPSTDYTYWVALYKWNSGTRTETVYPLSDPVVVTTDAAPVPVTTKIDSGRTPEGLSARQNVVDHMVLDIEDGVDLEWIAPGLDAAGVTGYVVYRRDLGETDGDWEFIGETNDQDFTDFGIDYSQDYPVYEYAVAAMRGTKQSELSNVGVGQVNLNPSDKQVTHVAAMQWGISPFTVTWLALGADVVEYRIQRILPPDHPSRDRDEDGDEQVVDTEWTVVLPVHGSYGQILEFTDNHQHNRASGMWSYRVKAKLGQDLPEDFEVREWSLPGRVYVNDSADPHPVTPEPPEGPTSRAPWGVIAQQERMPADWRYSPGDVVVSWNPPTDEGVDPVVEYLVFCRPVNGSGSGSWVYVTTVPDWQHTIVDSGPTEDVTEAGVIKARYEYRVGARRALDSSPDPHPGNPNSASWSVPAYVQVLSLWEPDQPTGLAARQIGPGYAVEVYWYRPSEDVLDGGLELSGYKMQRRPKGETRWQDLSDIHLLAHDEFYQDDDAALLDGGDEHTLEYRVRPLYTNPHTSDEQKGTWSRTAWVKVKPR